MAANLAQRGAGALRYLRLPTRVVHTNARRVIFPAANGRFSNPIAKGLYPAAAGKLINSYATAASSKEATRKPKTTATKRKTTKGTKGAPKKKKTTKKAASKAPAKPKKKKQLTEKQKVAKDAKELREKVKELKEASLTPPKRLADRAWTLSLTSKLGDALKSHQSGKDAFKAAADMAKMISEEEKEVRAPIPLGFLVYFVPTNTAGQQFAAQAEANRAANKAAYEAWIKSHTPLQIKEANQARRRLARVKDTSVPLLEDGRLVKRPRTAYFLYLHERTDAGDFKHMAVKDVATKVAEEWKGLTSAEKEVSLRGPFTGMNDN